MKERRKIRENEVNLIIYLLEKLGLNTEQYPIKEEGEEYEYGKMGSISMGNPDI